MNLPKPLAQWVSKRIAAADDKHYEQSLIWGFDTGDVDDNDEFAWALRICFPEKGFGQRSIDWVEVRDTVWLPIRSKLKLCKLGWHAWSYCTGQPEPYAFCCDCHVSVLGKAPTWANN